MYILENMFQLSDIKIKKSNYISIISDDINISRDILMSFYNYFSEKKNLENKKILIMDYYTGEKIKKTSKYPIYIENSEINSEVELGSKTILYQRILKYFKEKFPIEPTFLTLNSLIENFFLEDIFEQFKKEFSLYSKYSLEFDCKPFTPNDIIKKLDVKYTLDLNKQDINYIPNFEKIKLKLSMYEMNEIIGNKEKIYIFYYPERLLTTIEVRELKLFLKKLLTNNSIVIVATNSKYLIGDNIDDVNIIYHKKLLNFEKVDELKEKYLQNYPKLQEWKFIEKRLIYLIKNYILENFQNIQITNKITDDINKIVLNSYEDIFIIIFYLKEIGISYLLDINYDNECVFSNYLNKNFYNIKENDII